jgi:hypothetical protein
VEGYKKEIKIAMIRANAVENKEIIMTRFLNGLNSEITSMVELQYYIKIEDLVYMTTKIEKQLKR